MLGYGSSVVNGQLVPVGIKQSFDPLTFGQAYTGPGYWPRQGVYNVPPVLPSGATAASMAPASYGSTNAGGGGGVFPSMSSESGNPFHPTKSPLWWGLGFLVIGLLMLQYVHYGK
jgi:hypothetical protein